MVAAEPDFPPPSPRWPVRLAALGGAEAAERLRLSRHESRAQEELRFAGSLGEAAWRDTPLGRVVRAPHSPDRMAERLRLIEDEDFVHDCRAVQQPTLLVTGEACPVCGDVIREVSFADRSLQYCATCQTGGKPLADRRMSKLLK